jgi:HK97 family phage portal protein
MNWWQCGYTLQPYGECSAIVEACISAYAQTIAMCPGDHWRARDDGGRTRVTTSALSRIMRRPNDYETISNFLMNLTRRLYAKGEAFGVALRNDRGEIAELHLMREGAPRIAEDGSIFYSLTGNEILDKRIDLSNPVPGRDVLHVRLQTPRHPLKGESPILAAALDLAMSGTALGQQIAYYQNEARPSFLLQTDDNLTLEQVSALRNVWDAQTKGTGSGGSPILTGGTKAQQMSGGTAEQGQLADLLKWTEQNIALAFRVPLPVLGIGGTQYSSTELQMQAWIASGLGFGLNHIEVEFDRLFGLRGPPDEYTEFDTKVLLRSAFKDRIEGLSRGVLSGIYAPNEARAEVELKAVAFGDEPRVQQQVVPLSAAEDIPSAPPAPGPEAAPGPATPSPEDSANAAKSARAITRRGFRRQVYADAA